MKRIIFLALIILALSASLSYGEVQEFTKFTMDIPEGWTAKEDGQTVSVTKNDETALVSVTIGPLKILTLEQVAEAFRENLGGTKLEKDKDGSYKFSFNDGNARTLLSQTGEEYIFFVMDGINTAGDEIISILSSLKDK